MRNRCCHNALIFSLQPCLGLFIVTLNSHHYQVPLWQAIPSLAFGFMTGIILPQFGSKVEKTK